MIKELVHDPIFLSQRSSDANVNDVPAAHDLLDTIMAHRDECVGMAANMIGIKKRIIVFCDGAGYTVMLNPEIVRKSGAYKTKEGCLSLLGGERETERYKKITVTYQTCEFKSRTKTYTDFTAQIIQHEIDHCNGILI